MNYRGNLTWGKFEKTDTGFKIWQSNKPEEGFELLPGFKQREEEQEDVRNDD